ncbi:aldehyde dehydrogenase family protein [Luteolibacter marinus]|uniref:aldehyde dehydrogenase family protein n=1 Tax=Luteolibacter marinus TaxID=2776705 RepID=UPI0018687860|nr:aldehyde dehydrogenase family protein [Luteolibacter marinus]
MSWKTIHLPALVAGRPVETGDKLEVRYPWDGSLTGTVAMAGREHLESAIQAALDPANVPLDRYSRHKVLRKAAALLAERRAEFAALITRESGLAAREADYETGRSSDVLEFAAMETLRDDGQVFSCDVSPQGKPRKIITTRSPLALVGAITPFNHPLNQVAHKLAPAIAAGSPVILKPSDKTPLTAIRFAQLLYEAGLPGWMLSVLLGPLDQVVTPLVADPRVELLSFTGSVAIGKTISATAGYKKLCLELGGNSPLIVLDDADVELAARLAAEGSFRNSGQRCTAVKRILVQRGILERFTARFTEVAATYAAGDPEDPETRVGTVIDEAAARVLEQRVRDAEAAGAKVLLGGGRRGALMEPTVLAGVPRDAGIVACESFGPLAPIIPVDDLDDAISYYNSGSFGLSSGIVTNDLELALRACKELKCGTTNVNEVPGYRIESSPFGGIKDSGLGIKEGVIEAIKFMSHVKTFSLPW